MKQTRIQVAAPEAGIVFDIGHEHTPWQRYSSAFKTYGKPRQVYPYSEEDPSKPGRLIHHRGPLRNRHLSKTIRGKKAIRADKRKRHAAMKSEEL